MVEIIKHYWVLILSLVLALVMVLLLSVGATIFSAHIKNSYSGNVKDIIKTVYEDAEFMETEADSGTFIHNGKEYKYHVEDGKIKYYNITDTGDVEVKTIKLNKK